jgi:hypothetical protein
MLFFHQIYLPVDATAANVDGDISKQK